MKKNKLIAKALSLSALFVTGGCTLATVTSCSKEDVKLFTVTNNKNLSVTFCDTGASIYSIYYKGKCMTYQPEDKDDFAHTVKNSGKILGRTCGRIAGGRMNIRGKDYKFSTNEGKNTLHGGKQGLSSREWSHDIEKTDNATKVTFTYTSYDRESGYPLEVKFRIIYTIPDNEDKINIDMWGLPNSDNPYDETPICLSNHTYWRLGGDDVLNHTLKIPASYIANSSKEDQIIDAGCIPVGQNFDFRGNGQLIGKHIKKVAQDDPVAGGYDHGWIFDNHADNAPNVVELSNNNTHLYVRTDINMVFIYANCKPVAGCKIKDYGEDKLYGGVSIEPMTYFYRNHYDSILKTKDKPFHNYIEYELKTDN